MITIYITLSQFYYFKKAREAHNCCTGVCKSFIIMTQLSNRISD